MSEASPEAYLQELEAQAEAAEAEAEELSHQADTAERRRAVASEKLSSKEHEAQQLRSDAALLQRRVEEEEEYIANQLLMRLKLLEKEKEQLAQQVEIEEEFLVNSLHKELAQLSFEKDELERHLKMERKYIVTKLRKQLKQSLEQKKALEKLVENPEACGPHLMNILHQYKATIGEVPDEVPQAPSQSSVHQHQQQQHPSLSASPARQVGGLSIYDSDSDSVFSTFSESTQQSAASGLPPDATIRKLQKEILRLQQLCAAHVSEATGTAEKCDTLRQQLEQLSQDNFLKDVKAHRLREELSKASGEVNQLVLQAEVLSESEVTSDIRSGNRRASSASNPKHLKAHTEQILARPPPSPQSTHFSLPTSWATPPVTPCLSPRSSSGTSTPTYNAGYTSSGGGRASFLPHRRSLDPCTPRDMSRYTKPNRPRPPKDLPDAS